MGNLRQFGRENGLNEEFICLYKGGMISALKDKSKILYAAYQVTLGLLYILSLGTYNGSKSDMVVVLRKPID